jgi:lipopolysaccharide export system permease protein
MKTVQRLYLKDFLALLALLAVGLSAIFALLDLTGKIDDFILGKAPAEALGLYALYNIPRFLLYLLPLSVLICSLFTFSQASRRREITAIKSAGGRLRTVFYPFVAAGVLLSIFSFFVGEVVAPDFAKRAADLEASVEGKERDVSFKDGGLWLKDSNGNPVKVDLYIAEKKAAEGLTIFVIGSKSLEAEITARRADWDGRAWVLEDVVRYDMATGKTEKLRTMEYEGLASPEVFSGKVKTPDEMGLFELYGYMKRLKKAGFRNVKLSVDINSKISFPLINIVMMLLGIALSLEVGIGSGLFSAGLGLLISLLYWFSYTFALSMGYAGILPPFISAWLVPFSFGAFSVYLYARMPE